MSLFLATISTLLMSGQPDADHWPPHGYFQVTSSRGSQGQTLCHLQGSAQIRGEVFALIIRGSSEEELEGVLVSPRAEISAVERVVVTIDGERALRFTRAYAQEGRVLTSVVGLVEREEAQAPLEDMRHRAAKATWFGVSTSIYTDEIPAAGLSDALDDFQYCLQPLLP